MPCSIPCCTYKTTTSCKTNTVSSTSSSTTTTNAMYAICCHGLFTNMCQTCKPFFQIQHQPDSENAQSRDVTSVHYNPRNLHTHLRSSTLPSSTSILSSSTSNTDSDRHQQPQQRSCTAITNNFGPNQESSSSSSTSIVAPPPQTATTTSSSSSSSYGSRLWKWKMGSTSPNREDVVTTIESARIDDEEDLKSKINRGEEIVANAHSQTNNSTVMLSSSSSSLMLSNRESGKRKSQPLSYGLTHDSEDVMDASSPKHPRFAIPVRTQRQPDSRNASFLSSANSSGIGDSIIMDMETPPQSKKTKSRVTANSLDRINRMWHVNNPRTFKQVPKPNFDEDGDNDEDEGNAIADNRIRGVDGYDADWNKSIA
eukprot:m.20354 g.20354  ORF g.20354 m.20354 type:complete len:369 (-) comp5244_c0_seq1:104-1210(-)